MNLFVKLPAIAVANKIAPIIRSPPIVGVPDLSKCDLGPSSLAVSPYFFFLSQAMKGFPQININKNAIINATDALNIIDLKIRKTLQLLINNSCSKYNILYYRVFYPIIHI